MSDEEDTEWHGTEPAPSSAFLTQASADGLAKTEAAWVATIQDATKWILSSLGAMAVVILAGVRLSSIGSAHGLRLIEAIAFASIAVLGLGLALYAAVKVVVSRPLTLSSLNSPEESELRDRVEREPVLAEGRVASLVTRREYAAHAVAKFQDDLLEDRINNTLNAPAIEPRLQAAQDRLAAIDSEVTAVEWVARHVRARGDFVRAMIALAIATALVLIGSIGFLIDTTTASTQSSCSRQAGADAASPLGANAAFADFSSTATSSEAALPCDDAPIPKGMLVAVTFTAQGFAKYAAAIGSGKCKLSRLPRPLASTLGGTWSSPLIYLTEANGSAQSPCVTGDHFRLGPDDGSVAPLGRATG